MKLIYIPIFIVIYRFVSNYYFLNRIEFLYKVFLSVFDKSIEIKGNVTEYQHELVELLKRAEIQDRHLPISIPMGFGYVSNTSRSIFDNLFVNDSEISPLVNQFFNQAKGVYKLRMKQSYNPFFWIDSIVFLPKTLSKYFGIESNSVIVKIINILYWIVSFFVFVYTEQIQTFFQSFLSKLIK